MAYIFNPHVEEVKITISVIKAHQSGTFKEEYTFISDRDGMELTNQIADTVVSALHLASAVKRERNK